MDTRRSLLHTRWEFNSTTRSLVNSKCRILSALGVRHPCISAAQPDYSAEKPLDLTHACYHHGFVCKPPLFIRRARSAVPARRILQPKCDRPMLLGLSGTRKTLSGYSLTQYRLNQAFKMARSVPSWIHRETAS